MSEGGRWQETIGVGFGTGLKKGTTKRTAVMNERTGRVGGYQTEHWDDRMDAEVNASSLKVRMNVEED